MSNDIDRTQGNKGIPNLTVQQFPSLGRNTDPHLNTTDNNNAKSMDNTIKPDIDQALALKKQQRSSEVPYSSSNRSGIGQNLSTNKKICQSITIN